MKRSRRLIRKCEMCLYMTYIARNERLRVLSLSRVRAPWPRGMLTVAHESGTIFTSPCSNGVFGTRFCLPALVLGLQSQAVPCHPPPKRRLRISALSALLWISASASWVPFSSLARIGGSRTFKPLPCLPCLRRYRHVQVRMIRKAHTFNCTGAPDAATFLKTWSIRSEMH